MFILGFFYGMEDFIRRDLDLIENGDLNSIAFTGT